MMKSKKMGVDDWFAANPDKGLEDLVKLAANKPPQIDMGDGDVVLLDERTEKMTRPIAIVCNRAYLATWGETRRMRHKVIDKDGNAVPLNEPEEVVEERIIVIRDDGRTYGNVGRDADHELNEIDLEVDLPTPLPDEQSLSIPAYKKYRQGYRADPMDVFGRVVDVVDRFIEFSDDPAVQRVICEVVSCWILATHFLPAWEVSSNLWAIGERGSGKTQLLLLAVELAYLGTFMTTATSYAVLRNIKAYGGTACIDDAENLSGGKMDNDNFRSTVLVSNKRNASIPVNVGKTANTWEMKRVCVYSFNVFTSIKLPDTVLGSRSIPIRLIRTVNKHKVNSNPSNCRLWPHDQQELVDDLMLLALDNMTRMSTYWDAVDGATKLEGRPLEPYRSVLAIAQYLEDEGEDGLFDRVNTYALTLEEKRASMEYDNLIVVMIKAIVILVADELEKLGALDALTEAAWNTTNTRNTRQREIHTSVPSDGVFLATNDIANKTELIAMDESVSISLSIDPRKRNTKVGLKLTSIGYEGVQSPRNSRLRGRNFPLDKLAQTARSYNVDIVKVVSDKYPGFGEVNYQHVPQTSLSSNGNGPDGDGQSSGVGDVVHDVVSDEDLWQGSF